VLSVCSIGQAKAPEESLNPANLANRWTTKVDHPFDDDS
jgi:hypothetical protein